LPPLPFPDPSIHSKWGNLEKSRRLPGQEVALLKAEQERKGRILLEKTVEILRSSGIDATGLLLRGDVASEIVEYASENQMDLIVTGSGGDRQVEGWLLGSVARKLAYFATSSILVVKSRKK
jgi:nucleotide-binding universal stress UspA family protein